MQNYKKVQKSTDKKEEISENEIRVTAGGRIRSYITYATKLFLEKKQESVVLKSMGRAINKTVSIVEIIKRRVAGLHQTTEISSSVIVDTWEPLEEGLNKLETHRTVSSITVVLSLKKLDESHLGYQQPIPESEVSAPKEKKSKEDGENTIEGFDVDEEDGEKPKRNPRKRQGGRRDGNQRKGGDGNQREGNQRDGNQRRNYNNQKDGEGNQREGNQRDGNQRRNNQRDGNQRDGNQRRNYNNQKDGEGNQRDGNQRRNYNNQKDGEGNQRDGNQRRNNNNNNKRRGPPRKQQQSNEEEDA